MTDDHEFGSQKWQNYAKYDDNYVWGFTRHQLQLENRTVVLMDGPMNMLNHDEIDKQKLLKEILSIKDVDEITPGDLRKDEQPSSPKQPPKRS